MAVTTDVLGFTLGVASAGVKDGTPRRTDVALIVSEGALSLPEPSTAVT